MTTIREAVLSQRRLMVLVVLVGAAFVLFFPTRQLVQQRRHIDDLQRRVEGLSSENRRLSREVGRLEDPAELEVLARERLGLVRPGEHAYFLEPPKPAKPSSASAAPREPSFFSRMWARLVSLLRGRG